MPTDNTWRQRAACRKSDPELFFPAGKQGAPVAVRYAPALALCQCCEVRGPCLAYAVEAGESQGIWGGVLLSHKRLRELRAGLAS